MSQELQTLDNPSNLILSDLERQILDGLAQAKSPKELATSLGIPRTAITSLMRKDGVMDFVQELVDARNQIMKMYLPDLLMDIIEDKVEKNKGDEEKRLADLTKKDVVDVAKQLNDMLKTTGSVDKEEAEDKFAKIYQQINIIQKDQ